MFYTHNDAVTFAANMEKLAVDYDRRLFHFSNLTHGSMEQLQRAHAIYRAATDNIRYTAKRARIYISGGKPEGVENPEALERHMSDILHTSMNDISKIMEVAYAEADAALRAA